MRTRPSLLIPAMAVILLASAPFAPGQSPAPSTEAPPAASEQVITLSPFTVSTNQDVGYLATNAASATRINGKIQDIPMGISVITRDFIEDIGAVDLSSATRYSGVVQDINFSNPGSTLAGDANFSIRGLQGAAVFRDGFSSLGMTDSANIDRVEVVKGPASVFYGNASPGGLLNYTTKQPTTKEAGAINLFLGSYSAMRAELDYNKPLSADNSVLARLNAAVGDYGSFRRFEKRKSQFLAPIVRWEPARGTVVSLAGEYMHQDQTAPSAIPEWNSGSALVSLYRDLPRDFNVAGDNGKVKRDKWSTTAIVEHTFSDEITTRLSFNNWASKDKVLKVGVTPSTVYAGPYSYTPSYLYMNEDRYAVRNDWFVAATTGSISHKFIFGAEKASDDTYLKQYNGKPTQVNPFLFSSLPDSFFDAIIPVFPDPSYTLVTRSRGLIQSTGIYGSDIISAFDDKLHFLVGGRHDTISVTNKVTGINASRGKFSPQISGLGRLSSEVSLYLSYSTSLTPNGIAGDGQLYLPEEGIGKEVGLKFDFLKSRFVGTVSAYDITRKNIVVPVYTAQPDGSAILTSAVAGSNRSRGFDTDWVLTLTPQWQAVLNYTNQNPVIEHGRAGVTATAFSPDEGQQALRAPKEQGSVWTKYAFKAGSLKGLSLGVGTVYMGRLVIKKGPVAGAKDLLEWAPSWVHYDASLTYAFTIAGHSASVGVKCQNLFDRKDIASQSYSVAMSAPRTFTGTFDFKF